jgi:hypothetical protein
LIHPHGDGGILSTLLLNSRVICYSNGSQSELEVLFKLLAKASPDQARAISKQITSHNIACKWFTSVLKLNDEFPLSSFLDSHDCYDLKETLFLIPGMN